MKLTEDQVQYANIIVEEARKQGVNPQLALSVAFTESNFNPSAVSPKGAIGLMQLMPSTAEELGVDPNDPKQNVQGGIRYLKQLNERFENDPVKVLSAYNAGPNAKFFQTGNLDDVPTETLQYVTKIAGINNGTIPSIAIEQEGEEGVVAAPTTSSAGPAIDPEKVSSAVERRYGQLAGGTLGLGAGAALQTAGALGNRFRSSPSAAPTAPTAPTEPQARPGPVRPPLGGTGTQNYARAFGLGDIEAGRAADMTKQPGGVHDLTTQRRTGLQRVNELFPNQFREDPRFGGLMTPEERPGPGPRSATGQIGGAKPPPLVKPPSPLKQITSMFQDMASAYPKAARGVANIAQKAPVISYPLAGVNIGGETMSALNELSKENPDYLEAVLSSMGALGTGLSMYPPTAPFGIPMAAVPPIVRYFRDRPPEEDPSLGLAMP